MLNPIPGGWTGRERRAERRAGRRVRRRGAFLPAVYFTY